MPDDLFLMILRQSKDYPVEISSSREPSPVESSASLWINFDSGSSRRDGSDSNTAQDVSMREKLMQLEKTVALLQAPLQAPPSATPKVAAFNAIVDLVKDTVSTEVLVAMQSPQKKGCREASHVLNRSLIQSNRCLGMRML